MILILLKNSKKIVEFGNSFTEYGSGYLVSQNAGGQVYCSKQNCEMPVEYEGDFPLENFEPYKYLLRHGRIVEDPDFIPLPKLTEYGVPEDVVEQIRGQGANAAFDHLVERLAETGYKEIG